MFGVYCLIVCVDIMRHNDVFVGLLFVCIVLI